MSYEDRKLKSKSSHSKPRIHAELEKSEWTGTVDQPSASSAFTAWVNKTTESLSRAVQANDTESVGELLEMLEAPCVRPKKVVSGEVQGSACELVASKIRSVALKASSNDIHDLLLGEAENLDRASAAWAKEYKPASFQEQARGSARSYIWQGNTFIIENMSTFPTIPEGINHISLRNYQGTSIPNLPDRITYIDISDSPSLTSLPSILPSITHVKNAPNLILQEGIKIREDPLGYQVKNSFTLNHCESVTHIPDSLSNIESFGASYTGITEIPTWYKGTTLHMQYNPLKEIPPNLKVKTIDVSDTPITHIPYLPEAKWIDARRGKITSIAPGHYGVINIDNNPIKSLPNGLKVKSLNIQETGITELPPDLEADEIDIRKTGITSIPPTVKIKKIISTHNRFRHVRGGNWIYLDDKTYQENLLKTRATEKQQRIRQREREKQFLGVPEGRKIPSSVANMTVSVPHPDYELLSLLSRKQLRHGGASPANISSNVYRFMPPELKNANPYKDTFYPYIYRNKDGTRGVKWMLNKHIKTVVE